MRTAPSLKEALRDLRRRLFCGLDQRLADLRCRQSENGSGQRHHAQAQHSSTARQRLEGSAGGRQIRDRAAPTASLQAMPSSHPQTHTDHPIPRRIAAGFFCMKGPSHV